MNVLRRAALALFVVAGPACPSGSGVEGDDGHVVTVDGLRLEVLSTKEQGRIGELYAGPDNRYVIVELRLDNEAHAAPVSVASPLFALRTAASVEFLGAAQTELLSNACESMAQVAEGGTYECRVAFVVPHDEEASALVYRPDDDTEVAVEFDSERCSPCADDCVDLTTNDNHCGECFNEVGPEQSCADAEATCADDLTACGTECVDLQSDPAHCGECGASIPASQACTDGMGRCPDAAPAMCGSTCVDLQTDVDNCGECGRRVESCIGGEPSCPEGAQWCGNACVNTYWSDAHCGGCGIACVSGFECYEAACSTYVESNIGQTQTTCANLCSAEGLGCASAGTYYTGTTYCDVGGGYDTHTLPGSCNAIPAQSVEEALPNGCTFYGDASRLECWCAQP